jgi:hypothetical protein
MTRVVMPGLAMATRTQNDGVVDAVTPTIGSGFDVMYLRISACELMAHATKATGSDECVLANGRWEWHLCYPSLCFGP